MKRRKFHITAAIMLALLILTEYPACADFEKDNHMPKSGEKEFIVSFVKRLKINHSELKGQDVYKALFQYANGNEHSIDSEKQAMDALVSESSQLDTNEYPDEKLIEFLCDDLSICRVNLRPFIRSHGSVNALSKAMLLSSEEMKKDTKKFYALWQFFVLMINEGSLTFSKTDVETVDKEARSFNYERNFHHSPEYRDRYKPSYRVILSKYLESLW